MQFLFLMSKLQSQETPIGAAEELQKNSDHIAFFTSPASWLLDMQCSSDVTGYDRYYLNLLVNALAIPSLMLIFGLPIFFWNLIVTSKCCKNGVKESIRQSVLSLWSLSNILTFLFYPNVIFTILSPFNCMTSIDSVSPEDTGQEDQPLDQLTTRLVAHPDTICYSSEWYSLMVIAIPALIVYLFLLPCLGMRHISAKKDIIFYSGRDDPELSDELRKQAKEVKEQYGFLISGLTISKQIASDNVPDADKAIQQVAQAEEVAAI